MSLDVLFINPGNASGIYQELSNDFSAIETPTWSLLLAQSCRSKGFKVAILDVNALRLTNDEAYEKILELNPRLLSFVVYGQNPNAGSVSMDGAVSLINYIKEKNSNLLTSVHGSHVSALPIETLDKEKNIDIIFTNEGVYSLWDVLSLKNINLEELKKINGLCLRDKSKKSFLTKAGKIVPQNRMDIDLPGYAWDLLPYKIKPLDLYRSHFWHANYDFNQRTPFASIYTSLGCVFNCNFCMINILNRDDNSEIGTASDYAVMRFWSPEFIIKEFDKLVKLGVKTLRIADEMFLLNKKYYIPLCELLIERGYGDFLNMWAYSRVDTINEKYLNMVRKAGIRTLCLGIESGDQKVRLEVSKGSFKDFNIREVIKKIHDNDIEVLGNYLFGLTGDNHESMQKTLDLSLELNTIGWNAYPVMPFPGSQIYTEAKKNNEELPTDYLEFSYHSYLTKPLGTKYLTPAEVLKFRDYAFTKYHTNKNFLAKVKNKFGEEAVNNILKMTKIKLKRKLLGD